MAQDSKSPTMSPTVPKKVESNENTVTFFEAIASVVGGATVTKLEWNDPEIIVEVRNEKLMIRTDDGLFHPLILTIGDMNGEDWIILHNPK